MTKLLYKYFMASYLYNLLLPRLPYGYASFNLYFVYIPMEVEF